MTYEYLCTACGHQWEADQRISEQPLRKCPKCRRATAKRQVSGGMGFILKGGGWYADGYTSGRSGSGSKKGEQAEQSASQSSSGSAKSESSSGAKSESSSNSTPSKPGSKGKAGKQPRAAA